MAKKCMERCLTSLTIKETQMKTTVRTSKVLFAKQSSTFEMAEAPGFRLSMEPGVCSTNSAGSFKFFRPR